MRKSERPNRKNDYTRIQEKLQEVSKVETTAIAVTAVGGSINNLAVQTEAFKTWLTAKQEANFFIGKHVTSAPEYAVDSKAVGDATETVMSAEAVDELKKEAERQYDPTATDGVMVDDTEEATKVTDNAVEKFIDIVIVENATKKLIGKSDEEIESHAVNQMRQYHEDTEYKPEIDVAKAVQDARQVILITSKEKDKKNIDNVK